MNLLIVLLLIHSAVAIPWLPTPNTTHPTLKARAKTIAHHFAQARARHSALGHSASPLADDDLRWINTPRAWHQQTARTIDHRFLDFPTLLTFARQSKLAGVSNLMLVQIQNTTSCPGGWYNGLQLCNHINGSFPAAGGNLSSWQAMVDELKPMRLSWWTNPTYWSTQGSVWATAAGDPLSDVGRWFSWNATKSDECWGNNPMSSDGVVPAQGSWGSTGAFSGVESAMASFGSETYAKYTVDAMANSWTKNLGIDGYTVDCSVNYIQHQSNCQNGMMQCGSNGDAQAEWSKIVDDVRVEQPQVVLSGEYFESWEEVIHSNSDIGGQGFPEYHTVMQSGVMSKDLSQVEAVAKRSGSDAASVLCYLHPYFDGRPSGAL